MDSNIIKIQKYLQNELEFCSLWTNSRTLKSSRNSSITIFYNRNFNDDYFFNRIHLDNENDMIESLAFLTKFLTKEGISGYLYTKNDSVYFEKQIMEKRLVWVDSIYTLESPGELINIKPLNLDKEISITKINDPISLETWTRIFCRSFNIKDHYPVMNIVNKKKQSFVFLLAVLKKNSKEKHKNMNETNTNYTNNRINDNDYHNYNIPAGVCLLFERFGCIGLYCLGTLPEFRNNGIAQMILKTSIQIAKTMKYEKIFLQSFQNDNYIDFYKKLRFKILDKRKIFKLTN